MSAASYPSSRIQSERTIALARVVLAATALFAIWLDPAEPTRYASLTYGLYWMYLVYSAALALWTVGLEIGDWFPLATHAVDITAFSVFQYLTLGPSSPFFVYFIFSMFCGAVRWGWRGTLLTGGLVSTCYVGMAVSIDQQVAAPAFEVNRFVVRVAYLAVATGMLVYLGRYEARLRTEIERLARWPPAVADDPEVAIGRVLEYGAELMQAQCVVAIWAYRDEPRLHAAHWTPDAGGVRTYEAGTLDAVTDATLAGSTFMCTGPVREAQAVFVSAQGRLMRREGVPVAEDVRSLLTGDGLVTSPIRSDAVSGRVFFSGVGSPTAETVPLTEVVAREIASSLDQIHSARHRQEITAREERLRVARDLHDGVLQGLTGVRLELRALSTAAAAQGATPLKERLVSLERALAMEQRELRFFISGLEPQDQPRAPWRSTLAAGLDSVRERLALEWQTPVTLRIAPGMRALREPVEEAIPLMVHEAAVNALKHGHPSRVAVDIDVADGHVVIAVSDDGRGFPFKGRFTHEALVASHTAPRSLFERVTALGGTLSIESSAHGSRVEMRLFL